MFHILNGADVVIHGITIQNGDTLGGFNGGGILNGSGKLTLNRSVVRNNSANLFGGGIYNEEKATATIVRSTIGPGNDAGVSGGGILNTRSKIILDNSTVSGNTASFGAGIASDGSEVFGPAMVEIHQSTITGNVGDNTLVGGGIRNGGRSIVLIRNSIVAGNRTIGQPELRDCETDSEAEIVSGDFNLFGENGNSNGCPIGREDKVLDGNIVTAINTSLQGFPPHHALVARSPAIDAIPLGPNCTPPSYDQRNVARPETRDTGDAACDIGALEVGALELLGAEVSLSATSVDFGGQVIGTTSSRTVTLTNSGDSAVTLQQFALIQHMTRRFTHSGGTCVSGLNVAPKAFCTLVFTSKPGSANPRTAEFRILSDAPGSPHLIALMSRGIVP